MTISSPTGRRPRDVEYIFHANQGWREKLADGLDDLLEGARMWRVWTMLGWRDYRHQAARTVLGPLWGVTGMLVTVAVLGYVYGALQVLDQTRGYPFVAAGLISWFFLSGCIGGGPTVYVNAAGLLKERALPVSLCVYQYTLRMFIEFVSRLTVFIPVALFTRFFPGISLLFLFPALILYFINGLWVNMLLGTLGARYRDIGQIIGPLMLIAFLASPILWQPEMIQGNRYFAFLNPITHFVELIRHPLLGSPPPLISVFATIAITLGGWIVAFSLFSLKKNNIVFWL